MVEHFDPGHFDPDHFDTEEEPSVPLSTVESGHFDADHFDPGHFDTGGRVTKNIRAWPLGMYLGMQIGMSG